jgi:RNA 2',3'-cyclic 3'-phosphodiesterase
MTDQLSLDGFDEAPKPTDRLFFALFPDASTAEAMARFAQAACEEHGLVGRPVKAGRLHVTLHHLGDYAGLPEAVVRAGRGAAAQLQSAGAFGLSFDRLMSFHGSQGKRTLVLRGADDDVPLRQFQGDLGAAMARTPGLSRWVEKQFTPHVTLHYGWRAVEERAVPPFRWTAGEFVLVHSLLDRSTHIPLGRWPLVPR